ncbi:MAG: family 1 glycosylhydrolase [Brevundimonas sp.]|uniref:family 1 glycosylhydrolase n=1 Tax=Brevundimonas sp. TaxID=1871086 RepID=UPI003918D76F
MTPLELWGGHECTVNRVGDDWRDQTVASGHHHRIDDLDRFADLGFTALRYPVLWERTETAPGVYDWTWADARLQRLRVLGVRPIIGLLHHGSGPAWTDLLDPAFATGLARFAGAAAQRYDWVRDWTPVNEPLTTARFAALYGHWHPHRSDEAGFLTALVHQLLAVRAAMGAIRQVRPDARLIQTEDFGRTWGLGACEAQADYENRRRLLTWDLLTGRGAGGADLEAAFEAAGLADAVNDLSRLPCPPDLIGLNHYVTSDRVLDPDVSAYPETLHGGNGRLAYADVEAVRVAETRDCGWTHALQGLWRRYGIPLAVTECHLGAGVADQRRWLAECWNAAQRAREAGIPVEAVTVWALLGSHDWDSLVTRWEGRYETGVFDVSGGEPRKTPLADLVRRLAGGGGSATEGDGWWRTADRLIYPPARLSPMFEVRH